MSSKKTSHPIPDDNSDSFSLGIKRELTHNLPRKDESCKAVMDGIIESAGIETQFVDFVYDYIERLMQRDGVDTYGASETDYRESNLSRYFLRGVFLACGYASDPSRRYRIELHIKNYESAALITELMSAEGLDFSVSTRGFVTVIYLMKGDHVSDFLGVIGANSSRLEFESKRAEHEVLGNVNRTINFDSGNTKRQAEAGAVRNELIAKLMNSEEAKNLTKELRMAAEVNLANPGASIAELGKLMDPPIGKSGMNHRIQKLLEIAKYLD